jgi:acetylornithine deacetylase/succinyl-diaminopimelate desuccinylase-like protein
VSSHLRSSSGLRRSCSRFAGASFCASVLLLAFGFGCGAPAVSAAPGSTAPLPAVPAGPAPGASSEAALPAPSSSAASPGAASDGGGISELAGTTGACPRALSLDVQAIGAEVGCLLSRYVQLDTSNPPGNEALAARFVASYLAGEGIGAQIIESAPGRANVIARLQGATRGEALLLVHHMDVVPASAAEWSAPPFSGRLEGGYVYGRGSLDNKGGGVAELVAVALAKRLGKVPARDVVLLGVADEESGGAYGARWLTEKRPELFADVGAALNEGGAILQPAGRPLYNIELAQKAPLWLRVTAQGRSGHGAAPEPSTATTRLVRALARLTDHPFPIEVLPEVAALFRARAEAMPEPARSRYRDLRVSLRDAAFREQFLREPRDAALVRNTLAITMLAASPKENVISETASAVLDVRLLPGQEPARVQREIEAVLGDSALRVEPILSWRAYSSPRDTPLFSAIERLAELRDPGAPVMASVNGAFTDCNAFRAMNITCYGFLPIRIDPAELVRVHGKDERANVEALARAVLDLHALLELYSAPRPAAAASSSPAPGAASSAERPEN